MITRDEALEHSPWLWGLLAAAAGEVLLVVGWNLWEYRTDIRRWLKH